MEPIIELTKTDFLSVFLSVISILVGIKSISSILEWTVEKLGLETKWMRKRREEHELLVKTSQNLSDLQERHKKDMKRSDQYDAWMRSDIKKLTKMFIDKEIDDMRWEIKMVRSKSQCRSSMTTINENYEKGFNYSFITTYTITGGEKHELFK